MNDHRDFLRTVSSAILGVAAYVYAPSIPSVLAEERIAKNDGIYIGGFDGGRSPIVMLTDELLKDALQTCPSLARKNGKTLWITEATIARIEVV